MINRMQDVERKNSNFKTFIEIKSVIIVCTTFPTNMNDTKWLTSKALAKSSSHVLNIFSMSKNSAR